MVPKSAGLVIDPDVFWPAAPAPGVLGILDVAVLCLGLKVDHGSAGRL